MPVLVSRVAPKTPADCCHPKLHEGDQVVYINGIDVNGMLHEHVVNLIRQSRDTGNGELILTVRPRALYIAMTGDNSIKESTPFRQVYKYLSIFFFWEYRRMLKFATFVINIWIVVCPFLKDLYLKCRKLFLEQMHYHNQWRY